MSNEHFGEHLMIDGYDCNEDKLNDKEFILSFLRSLVEEIKMTMLGEPFIYRAPANFKKDPGGWSAFVVVKESHVSIHTFPGTNFVSFDIYTCSYLDKAKIMDIIIKTFNIKDIEVNFVIRGTRYPFERL